jgi:N-acyl-D-aspartate/D-glutamate deacylase
LETCSYATGRGGAVVGLATPLPRISLRSFLSGFVFDAFPGWREAMALPPDDKLRLLSDRAARARLHAASQDQTEPLLSMAQWHKMVIVQTFLPENKRYEGRIVADLAAEQGKTPFDALLDLACSEGLRTIFRRYLPPDSIEDWQARATIMRDRRVITGGSDAGAHLDMLSAFTLTTSLLQALVRETELMTVEELVHLFTGVPAQLYGLVDRGTIGQGAIADLVIFDVDTVGPQPVRTQYDLPGGAGRLYAEATGIDRVFVGGEEILAGGELTGSSPGTVIRSGRDTRATTLLSPAPAS